MGPQEAEQHEELPFSFHPWQKTVIDAIDGDADDRSILWVCSIAGNVGKSFLVNHLIEKRGALAIEPSKPSDVTHAILTRVETDDAFLTNPIIVVDVPRASSKMLKSDTFYKTLESKLMIHLTMSHVPKISMLRMWLGGPQDFAFMPSWLGRVFRLSTFGGRDDFDYAKNERMFESGDTQAALKMWEECRGQLGMNTPVTRSAWTASHERQQLVARHLP